MQNWVLSSLRCPVDGESLRLDSGELRGTRQVYPTLNEVPFLYPNPGMGLLEWGTKIQNYVREEGQHIGFAQQLSRGVKSSLTKERLKRQAHARQHNLAYVKASLHAFLTYPEVRVLPSSQQIHSYFQLFFRDWCWQGDETQQYLDYVSAQIDETVKDVLVLGSGAGGLSYGLAKKFPQIRWTSLEHNPFLALTADAIMQGQAIELYDYSLYPISVDKTAQSWTIKESPLGANHQSIIASYPHLPFAPQSFDRIVAPWFLDILDMPFFDAVRALLRFLRKGAGLVFFGPANVHKGHAVDQWTSDEICEAFEQLFQRVTHEQQTIAYCSSPLASQHRQETLLFAHCRAPLSAPDYVVTAAPARLRMTPELTQYKALNETFYKVLSVIERDIGVPELATKLVDQFGFTEEEAPFYAEFFIRKFAMEIGQQ
jgi:SAM-dependent methyltransferase